MSSNNEKFILEFEKKVRKTIVEFNLLNKKDKILVAVSGGKDSTTVLYLLHKWGYDVTAITIDLAIGDYTKKNIENMKKFCSEHEIKLIIVQFAKEFGYSLCGIKMLLKSKNICMNSCSVCGVLRRYLLNKLVRENNAAKVATGHNLDDEAESVMMNFFRNTLDLSARIGPISGSLKDDRFVPRVKPLYFCLEKDIEKYSRIMKFPVVYDPCPCRNESFRFSVLKYLDRIERNNASVKENIVRQFLAMQPKLKERYMTDKKMTYCKRCGEPAKKEICNACMIFEKMIG